MPKTTVRYCQTWAMRCASPSLGRKVGNGSTFDSSMKRAHRLWTARSRAPFLISTFVKWLGFFRSPIISSFINGYNNLPLEN